MYFDALILKISCLKNYFNVSRHKKHFKKQPQPQSYFQTGTITLNIVITANQPLLF